MPTGLQIDQQGTVPAFANDALTPQASNPATAAYLLQQKQNATAPTINPDTGRQASPLTDGVNVPGQPGVYNASGLAGLASNNIQASREASGIYQAGNAAAAQTLANGPQDLQKLYQGGYASDVKPIQDQTIAVKQQLADVQLQKDQMYQNLKASSGGAAPDWYLQNEVATRSIPLTMKEQQLTNQLAVLTNQQTNAQTNLQNVVTAAKDTFTQQLAGATEQVNAASTAIQNVNTAINTGQAVSTQDKQQLATFIQQFPQLMKLLTPAEMQEFQNTGSLPQSAIQKMGPTLAEMDKQIQLFTTVSGLIPPASVDDVNKMVTEMTSGSLSSQFGGQLASMSPDQRVQFASNYLHQERVMQMMSAFGAAGIPGMPNFTGGTGTQQTGTQQAGSTQTASTGNWTSGQQYNPQTSNVPTWDNNPGDLIYNQQQGASPGAQGNGTGGQQGNIAKFETPQAGWNALIQDLTGKINGNNSHGLNGSSTLADLQNVYAPGSTTWLPNVAKNLGVDINKKIGELPVRPLAEAIAKAEGYQGAPAPWKPTQLPNMSEEEKTRALLDENSQKAGVDPTETKTVLLAAQSVVGDKARAFAAANAFAGGDKKTAQDIITTGISTGGGQAASDYNDASTQLNQITQLNNQFQQYTALGGKTNIFVGAEADFAHRLGMSGMSPQLQDLANKMQRTFVSYRQSLFGSRITQTETAAVGDLAPSADKTNAFNQQLLSSAVDFNTRTLNGVIKRSIGDKGFAVLFGPSGVQQTSAPGSNAGPNEGDTKTIPSGPNAGTWTYKGGQWTM